VNLIAYSQLRPEQNNKASSLTNLFRNWGGSFGIAFVATAAERRSSFHQLNLGTNIASSSQALHDRASVTISQLMQHWFTSADAAPAALGVVFRQLLQQSEFLPSWTVSRSLPG